MNLYQVVVLRTVCAVTLAVVAVSAAVGVVLDSLNVFHPIAVSSSTLGLVMSTLRVRELREVNRMKKGGDA